MAQVRGTNVPPSGSPGNRRTATKGRPPEPPLPARVQEALGELVGVGLGVLAELMEEEVTEVVGPKGRHDPERSAVRHGHEAGEVTLGGRRVGVERPRVRATDGSGRSGSPCTATLPTATGSRGSPARTPPPARGRHGARWSPGTARPGRAVPAVPAVPCPAAGGSRIRQRAPWIQRSSNTRIFPP